MSTMPPSTPPSPPPPNAPRETPDPGAEKAAGLRGGWRVALIASLALNLLVIGAIGGALFGEWHRDKRPIVRDLGFGPYGAALSHADRVALLRAFARETGGFRAERRSARETFGKLLEVLRGEPFNQGQFRVLMTQQEQHMAKRLALGQRLLVQRVEAMTPKERLVFADRLQEALARHERRHPGHGLPPPRRAAPALAPTASGATGPTGTSGENGTGGTQGAGSGAALPQQKAPASP